MKQSHHVYPSYLSRRDEVPPWGDKDITVEVTITQHAMYHWCNFQLWGNREDFIAWRALSGHIGSEEAFIESRSLGGQITQRNRALDPIKDKEWREGAKKQAKALALRRSEDPEFDRKCRESSSRNGKLIQERRRKDSEFDLRFRENFSKGAKNREEKYKDNKEFHKNRGDNLSAGRESLRRLRNNPETRELLLRKMGKGTIWITDGRSNRRVPIGESIPDGWLRGVTRRTNNAQ